MVIDYDGKEYKLDFGFKFLSVLNDFYHVEEDGIRINQGLENALIGLIAEDPTSLVTTLLAALSTNDRKMSKKQVEDYLVKFADENEDGLDPLFKQLTEEVKKQPLTKKKAKEILKRVDQEVEKQSQ